MAVTNNEVTELYVAYFERAPDADGLKYWVEESGLTIEQISQSFWDSAEVKAKYPDTMDNATFVDTIYQNVFDRASETAGAVYWIGKLDSGEIAKSDMVMAVVNGAIDTDTTKDATILANKTTVGVDFAESGLNDTTQATDVMSGVTAEASSVTEAKAKTDVYAEETFKYKLTTSADTIVASSQDDIIKGIASDKIGTATLTDGDTIDGGEGKDTLLLSGGSTTGDITDIKSTLTNVETVELKGLIVDSKLNAENWAGVENYIFNKATGTAAAAKGTTVEDVADTLKSVKLSGLDNSLTTIKLADGLANSTIAVEISGAKAAAKNTLSISDDSVEKYNLTSTANGAGAVFVTAEDKKLTAITVDGDSDIALETTSDAKSLEKIDASALKAGIDITSSTNLKALAQDITVLGGTKDNKITLGNGDNKVTTQDGKDLIKVGTGDNTIITGAGDGHIEAGSGSNTITTGNGNYNLKLDGTVVTGTAAADYGIITNAGNDTITTGSGNDLISSGAGNDTINAGNGTNSILVASGTNSITTGTGNDTITLSDGINTVDAGTGTNTLDINGGAAILSGGSYSEITASGTTTSIDSSKISTALNVKIDASATVLTLKAGTFATIDASSLTTGTAGLVATDITSNITYKGAGGIDTISTGSGNDTITTGAGADVITLKAGANTVNAGAGKDTINAGTGVDKITVGKAESLATITTADTVTKFTSGSDKIGFGLAAAVDTNFFKGDGTIDNNGGAAITDLASALTAATAASSATAPGSVSTIYFFTKDTSGNGYLFADTDGTQGITSSDDLILLTGVTSLSEADILA